MKRRKERIDKLLVERGLVATRSQGKLLVMAGEVCVDGARAVKASTMVKPDAVIEVIAPAPYVGRGGFKLAEAVLATKSIPARSAKGFEMAYRLYARSRRMPKDVYKWWKTNEKRILLTLQAVHWNDLEEGGDAQQVPSRAVLANQGNGCM